MALSHFNNLVSSIAWTENYPKEGIRFADFSRVFGNPSLGVIATTVASALCIERGQIILGVPTRGCTWAALLANAAKTEAVFLSKTGVGTPLPDARPLASAGTAYSETASVFTIRTADVERLLKADIVWIADDVCESGKTLAAITAALTELGCKHVQCIPLLTIGVPTECSVIEYDPLTRICLPGKLIFADEPEHLLTLRGGTSRYGPAVTVFGPPSMSEHVLDYVAEHHGTRVGDIQWNTFDGGMPNVTFSATQNEDVVFIYDAALMDTTQDGVVHALARNCLNQMRVIIPYLPQGTMERVDVEGTLAIAQTTLHSLCASMPPTVKVEVYDIHQTGTRFYCGDRVKYIPRQTLKHLVPKAAQIIAFPDDGAAKRFRHLFPNKTLAIFTKARRDGKRIISLAEVVGILPIEGADVAIVDDLTRTGGTLMETAKVLRALGARTVAAVFVHADFDPGRTIPFARFELFDSIHCSNSIPHKARALKNAGAHVKVDKLFCKAFKTYGVILASSSETKLSATARAFTTRGAVYIWCGPVPSGVSEQPMSEEETIRGCQNRANFLAHLYGRECVVAVESGLRITAETMTDITYAIAPKRTITSVDGPTVPRVELAPGETLGDHLQKKHNLPSKDAWIGHFGNEDRAMQIYKILR